MRHRRTDIISRLQKGDQKKIAKRCNCHASTVSAILNGKSGQETTLAIKIIRCAERYTEINKRVNR